ncbi:tRNA (guanosine(46)-N7)-methyltransferase TrmB [Marinicella sp. W31]|uniref:tRNA (guanosine(46)-N7)-methyltransferase TrmB n=1 Tax=Marinicella sp. W31 TaxID=3023713 RepID=UPI0037566EF2
MDFDTNKRQIRSFVLRGGKMTTGQKKALDELWPVYGIEDKQSLAFPEIFGNENPVWLDIGFGNGESTAFAAAQHPDVNLLGIEVHLPGIGHLLIRMHEQDLNNVRIMRDDAVDVLQTQITDASLDAVHVYFPDPWHKKRHHKRRLLNADFISLVISKLKSGGRLHIATDWEEYALEVQALLIQFADLENTVSDNGFADRPAWRPETKFERRGQRLQHNSYDLILVKR